VPPSHHHATPAGGRSSWGLAMGLGVPAFASHKVTCTPANLADIRAFTLATLSDWNLRQQADEVTSVAHELLVQALALAGPYGQAPSGWIGLTEQADTLTCTLSLTGTAPAPGQSGALPDGDNTLSTRIIHALAQQWSLPGPGRAVGVLSATVHKGTGVTGRLPGKREG